MYIIVWEYEVRADRLGAFEALYGPAGAWARLFGQADEYRGTDLYRDTTRPTRYVTIDRWTSPAAFEAYIPTVRQAYQQLDESAAALTVRERRLGAFEGE